MPHNHYDWSKFTLRVNINNNAQSIYDAWTTPANLEKWFLREANFTDTSGRNLERNEIIETGHEYLWRWYGYSDDINEEGEILEANGSDSLKFRFGTAGTVSVKINQEKDYQLMELTQENIPTTEEGKVNFHIGCTKGWVFFLANLKSVLEGGVDLRNKDEELKDVITA